MLIEEDIFTLERDDDLPLRFSGNILATYTVSDTKYTLYLTDESVETATYVISVQTDNYANGKSNEVYLFQEEDDVRDFIIDAIGPYKSLIFQQQLGYEEVEILE